MAIVNCINTKSKTPSALKRIINYVTNSNKTEKELVSGKDIMPESAYEEMMLVKNQFNKNTGRQYLHMIQSFPKDENISYQQAHSIAKDLAEHYEGHQVLIATHTDKDHIHSHLIINSVNFENGKKMQQSYQQLQEIMRKSDQLCKKEGLSIIEKQQNNKKISKNEYHVAMKGDSWKMKLINDIDQALESSTSKQEYIHFLEQQGYQVNWKDTRKYITYTTPEGYKCRDIKLHDKKYTKEEMENVFNVKQYETTKSTGTRNSISQASNNYSTTRRLELHDKNIDRTSITQDGQYQKRYSESSKRYEKFNAEVSFKDGRSDRKTDREKYRDIDERGRKADNEYADAFRTTKRPSRSAGTNKENDKDIHRSASHCGVNKHRNMGLYPAASLVEGLVYDMENEDEDEYER